MTHKSPSSADDTATFLGDDEFPVRNTKTEEYIAEYINDYGKLPVTLADGVKWEPATNEEAEYVSERIRLEEKNV
jgi:hypothetical protein